ncbi:MAG: transposase, partial [Anaerolineae bacterium]
MTGPTDSFPVQRLDVVNTGRRRRWTMEEKLRIVAESFRGHRQVCATSRRHDISPSLLFSWRKRLREACHDGDRVVGFAPAVIVPDEAPPLDAAAGRMEIVTVTGQRIIVGADVDARALARVVAALEAEIRVLGELRDLLIAL